MTIRGLTAWFSNKYLIKSFKIVQPETASPISPSSLNPTQPHLPYHPTLPKVCLAHPHHPAQFHPTFWNITQHCLTSLYPIKPHMPSPNISLTNKFPQKGVKYKLIEMHLFSWKCLILAILVHTFVWSDIVTSWAAVPAKKRKQVY